MIIFNSMRRASSPWAVMKVRQLTAVAGILRVLRRFYVYELLLIKENFYKGDKTILHKN